MSLKIIEMNLWFYKAPYEKKVAPWEKGWVSQQIARHARGDHSHVETEFVFNNGDRRCISSSGRDGGVRMGSSDWILRHPERWDKVPVLINGKSPSPEKCNVVWAFMRSQDGKPYDWPGVTGFKVNFIEEDPDKWYCSEICQAGLHKAGLFPRLYVIHPEDMYKISLYLFRKVEDGPCNCNKAEPVGSEDTSGESKG